MRHWNRPMKARDVSVLSGLVLLIVFSAADGDRGFVAYYAALFALAVAAWTYESVVSYRKENRDREGE